MRKSLGVALLFSIIANAVLIYRVFDLGISVTYQTAEIQYKSKQLTDVGKLWPALTPKISRGDLLEAARKTGLEVLEKEEEKSLFIGRVQFLLSGESVTAIKLE